MMKVRALRDVWLGPGRGFGYKRTGDEFDYDGPEDPNLELVGPEQGLAAPADDTSEEVIAVIGKTGRTTTHRRKKKRT